MPSLSEIDLRRTVRGLFSYIMALSNGRACIKYVIGNSDKISGASNMSKIIKIKSNASTQLIQQFVDLMSIDEMSIDIWFISSPYVAQMVPYSTIVMVRK